MLFGYGWPERHEVLARSYSAWLLEFADAMAFVQQLPSVKHERTATMTNVAAIVFDLDDTLYAERDYVRSGFSVVAHSFVIELGDATATLDRLTQLFESPHRSRAFDVLLTERGLDGRRDLLDRMIHCYRNHIPTIRPFPDAIDAIDQLRGRVQLGLITDGRADGQRRKIRALGLAEKFDEIIVTSELGEGYSKPHPRAFEEMATRLGVAHNACVYVGDNPSKDFVAPNALGWRTIQVCGEGRLYGGLTSAPGGEPQQIIDSLHALMSLGREKSS